MASQPFRGLLTVDMRIPIALRLKLDSDRVARRVGNQAAKLIRKRLRRGQDGDGSPLPQPKDGSKPARLSGRLIRDIRYHKREGRVRPTSRRRQDVGQGSRGARSSFGLMRIHIEDGRWSDPMGSLNDSQWDQIGDWTEEAIAKELDSGRGGLIAELRRIKRTV